MEGVFDARGLKFAIVVARFNGFITDRLLSGALDGLARMGGNSNDIDVVRVPGAWELPVAVKALAESRRYDGIIALGAVIRGETPHFDYVAGESTGGLARVATETGVPVAMGVLTTNTVEQAIDRAGAKSGNKGFDAAMTAVEMVSLLRRVRERRS